MAKYEIIDANGAVSNIIEWDGLSPYEPEGGFVLRAVEEVDAEVPEVDLAQVRIAASMAIMDATGKARTKYAINTDHQSMIYDVKAQEADAYVLAGRPEDPYAFPVLVASAEANNRSVSLHADIIRAKRDVWVAIAAETERLRESGLNAVTAAQTFEQIHAAKDEWITLLEAL